MSTRPRVEREIEETFAGLAHAFPGPPWILGYRGSPLEAPENTRASVARALELGLDGVEVDVRACLSGELVLLADETLDRTSDASGALAGKTLRELAEVDAGGWFGARFRGERLVLLEEALALGDAPIQVVSLGEPDLVEPLARLLSESALRSRVRVASSSRAAVLEARDAGLAPILCASAPDEDDRRFVRDERLESYAALARGWREASPGTPAVGHEWSCERWARRADLPEDLLWAVRTPVAGLSTTEPARALAARALARLAPEDAGAWPVEVPELAVEPRALGLRGGDWSGTWELSARVRNPFPFDARVTAGIVVRRGAFEVEGLPAALRLAPGEEALVPFRLTGGSWTPGGDPTFFALYRWRASARAPLGRIVLDAPLVRVRATRLDTIAQRLSMLREAPGDADASMTVRRHGRFLLVSLESAGAVSGARTLVHLDGRAYAGGRGVRARLPEDFEHRAGGVPFSCGFVGVVDGPRGPRRAVRRWAGGVPDEIGSGAPGWLVPAGSA